VFSPPNRMKMKIDRIISIATLVASLAAIILVLKKPAPIARSQTPAAVATNAQSFSQKMDQFEQAVQSNTTTPRAADQAPSYSPSVSPSQSTSSASSPSFRSTSSQIQTPDASAGSQSKPEVHLNSDEITAVLAQALGAGNSGNGGLNPNASIGSGEPNIKDQQVTFEGDTVHGQFLTEIAGKDVWVTVSGHLSSENGYATFEPTEFKVGDLDVPVSLVNPELQKKLLEQKDRLKLPENVGGLKVQNGELVLQGK
jgi:hypothetical protein